MQTLSAEADQVQVMGVLANSADHALIVVDTHENYYLQRISRWWGVQVLGSALLVAGGVCLLAYEFTGHQR